MFNIKRKRIITTIKEVSDIVRNIRKYCCKIIRIGRGTEFRSFNEYVSKESYNGLNLDAIIELKDTKLELTTIYGPLELGKPCTYIFDLNGKEIFSVSGLQCFAEFSRYFKMPKAKDYQFDRLDKFFDEETARYSCSAKPILGYNKDFNGQELYNCYGYDVNSAYTYTIMNKIPDLNNPIFGKYMIRVGENQVGFILDDDLTMVTKGNVADIVFNLIDTPNKLKEYCNKYYQLKKETSGTDKLTAKAYLNLPIGYSQKTNPFFRSYVVSSCNNRIKSLLDKNSLFWNTDAIYSKTKRDFEIGNDLGEFKEISYKTIRYKGNIYQTDNDIPTYRGIPKQWFKSFENKNGRAFNILIDDIPCLSNKYEWDWDMLVLRRNYA